MAERFTLNPEICQEIYEIVASHRTKTRGSKITVVIDSVAGVGDGQRIEHWEGVVLEPHEIKKKGIGLTAGQP